MHDLFPDSLRPDALGADLIPYMRPTCFAIHPQERDLPRIEGWTSILSAGLWMVLHDGSRYITFNVMVHA